WVGTWRPHPRRGVILAELKTPGPKYWIPGTTGHRSHDPTRDKAPAYTFRGVRGLARESCSPGPRYFIDPSITKSGKDVPPSAHVTGRPKTKTKVTPGPSDYSTDKASKHVYYTPPVHSMVFRRKPFKALQTPGPATYTLPRLLGPNTAYTHANPCYSLRWKSLYNSCFQDQAKTPGPAAFPKVELDVYKKRAPKYTM
ncbi:ODF3A protein, partial [Smithornis capensis]|nr:ODF3A protein [Smithornis capensis]